MPATRSHKQGENNLNVCPQSRGRQADDKPLTRHVTANRTLTCPSTAELGFHESPAHSALRTHPCAAAAGRSWWCCGLRRSAPTPRFHAPWWPRQGHGSRTRTAVTKAVPRPPLRTLPRRRPRDCGRCCCRLRSRYCGSGVVLTPGADDPGDAWTVSFLPGTEGATARSTRP